MDIVAKIEELIKEYGPMTRAEMQAEIGDASVDKRKLAAVVSRMNKKTATLPKRLHIKSYEYDQEGQRSYPRALYDLGDKPDARRPASSSERLRKRYYQTAAGRVSNVFDMGLTMKQRIEKFSGIGALT